MSHKKEAITAFIPISLLERFTLRLRFLETLISELMIINFSLLLLILCLRISAFFSVYAILFCCYRWYLCICLFNSAAFAMIFLFISSVYSFRNDFFFFWHFHYLLWFSQCLLSCLSTLFLYIIFFKLFVWFLNLLCVSRWWASKMSEIWNILY